MLRLVGCRMHNLRDLTVEIPLGAITVVTGPSGSGKSTLVVDTLVPAVRAAIRARDRSEAATSSVPQAVCDAVEGTDLLDRIVLVDQSPLGRTARSTPATALGIWDEIRRVLAKTKEARLRGFGPGRFRFNAPGGRCTVCRGLGTRTLAMHFLPDVEIPCPACGGGRFDRATQAVRFRGRSVSDLLRTTLVEARDLFAEIPSVGSRLTTAVELGLGYLTLGRSALTLSGGEAQRIRLAAELIDPDPRTRTVYVLDEPTTGLHAGDVVPLWTALRRFAAAGRTVVLVEHQLDVIAAADRVLDLGPGGGRDGGALVAAGTPREIAACAESVTGAALRRRAALRR
jgi:excinuclease ABC subunit A